GPGNDTINVYDDAQKLANIKALLHVEADDHLADDVRTVLYADLDSRLKDIVDHPPTVYQKGTDNVVRKVPIVFRSGPSNTEVWLNAAKLNADGTIAEVMFHEEIPDGKGIVDVNVTKPSTNAWQVTFANPGGRDVKQIAVDTTDLTVITHTTVTE